MMSSDYNVKRNMICKSFLSVLQIVYFMRFYSNCHAFQNDLFCLALLLVTHRNQVTKKTQSFYCVLI